MNCKPGDLALIVGGSRFAGGLVEVLHAAPSVMFFLPDGYVHEGCSLNFWVIRSMGSPFDAPTSPGKTRKTMYAVGNDLFLRPLKGLEKDKKQKLEAV